MVTVTKKHQISFALIAVVFATAMIVASSGNMALATHKVKIKHIFNSQSIGQQCDQRQNSPVTTSGAISPPIASGINLGLCVNANLAGNAFSADQSR